MTYAFKKPQVVWCTTFEAFGVVVGRRRIEGGQENSYDLYFQSDVVEVLERELLHGHRTHRAPKNLVSSPAKQWAKFGRFLDRGATAHVSTFNPTPGAGVFTPSDLAELVHKTGVATHLQRFRERQEEQGILGYYTDRHGYRMPVVTNAVAERLGLPGRVPNEGVRETISNTTRYRQVPGHSTLGSTERRRE